MTVDWQSIILEPNWLERLDKQALKRFGQEGLAEEAAAYVLDQLAADNWHSCRQYTGKAKPQTFLYTLTGNLLEEFARKRFGRPRPPEWLKREGELWVSVWKMVCLERQFATTVVNRLCHQGNRNREFVEGVIRTIKARLPWCGSSNREIPASMVCAYDDNGNENSPGLSDEHTIDDQLEQNQLEDTLLLMAQLLAFLSRPSDTTECRNSELTMDNEKLQQLYEALDLTEEEQLLLAMAYQEGMKMNAIAKALNMPSYQPGRLLKGILTRIETALSQAGIAMDDIEAMLREDNE